MGGWIYLTDMWGFVFFSLYGVKVVPAVWTGCAVIDRSLIACCATLTCTSRFAFHYKRLNSRHSLSQIEIITQWFVQLLVSLPALLNCYVYLFCYPCENPHPAHACSWVWMVVLKRLIDPSVTSEQAWSVFLSSLGFCLWVGWERRCNIKKELECCIEVEKLEDLFTLFETYMLFQRTILWYWMYNCLLVAWLIFVHFFLPAFKICYFCSF